MKIFTSHKLFFTGLICLFIIPSINAQMMLKEISLERQISKSSLVVEGEIIDKKSFWNAEKNNIYSVNLVEVYKVFKGNSINTIEIITSGGEVDGVSQTFIPGLKLKVGDIGVFTLYSSDVKLNKKTKTLDPKYNVYSSLQGFYKYNVFSNVVTNSFKGSHGTSNSFYNEIENLTKSKYIEMSKFSLDDVNSKLSQEKSVLAPINITFSPTTASAGTENTLTISGSGFGETKGAVGFRDADLGGNDGFPLFNPVYIDALDSQILTWNDNEITVQIPSGAGTGDVRVIHNDGTIGVSGGELTISYALLNGDDGTNAFRTQHYSPLDFPANGNGSIVWQMNSAFDANTLAKEAFLRAFDLWRCETGVNWVVGDNTSISEAGIDDTSVISFGSLPDGTLGRYSFITGSCGDVRILAGELDIIFSEDINDPDTLAAESWYFGSDPDGIAFEQWDFQSVALHELGHAHQLGHVINTDNVMHYTLQNFEVQRTLSSNDVTAGGIIQNLSTTTTICSAIQMTNYSGNCDLSVDDNGLVGAISLFPNPTTGWFSIESESSVNIEKAIIYDISGRLISNIDLSNNSKTKTINLSGASKGLYFVNIHSNNGMITKKIILE
ncbi:MAG: T9SS type A sorting domain-containing protein [Algibacter sp.]